jgi:carboxynorspermidine decarboxylase
MKYYPEIKSPAFVLEEDKLQRNLELLAKVQKEADIKIILAFKAFSMWSVFPIISKYLAGATASSANEARLCYEEMGSKAYTYCAAIIPSEFSKLLKYSGHITFNSINQYNKYSKKAIAAGISCGIRVNPEYSSVSTDLYNPCVPGSRLGESIEHFKNKLPLGIEGLHFHALCESSSFDLEKTLASFENLFGRFLPLLKWVNFGGGHLITRKDYDYKHLITILKAFKTRYPNLEVILEPGSAIAWQTGFLLATVLDIHNSKGIKTLMLDVSFTAHMPDTLEMPYRPTITDATDPIPGKPTYRLGGTSCLSGDFMFEYSFDKSVKIGDRLILEDMIHYTMVKTTMFNGVAHPDLGIIDNNGKYQLLRKFNYKDYKMRLS